MTKYNIFPSLLHILQHKICVKHITCLLHLTIQGFQHCINIFRLRMGCLARGMCEPLYVPQKHWIMVASSLPSISSLSSTFLQHLIDIPRHRCLTTTYNIQHCLVLIQKCVLRLVFMDQYYSEFCISQARLPTHLHWVIMAYFWYCHALHLESLHSPKGQAFWK